MSKKNNTYFYFYYNFFEKRNKNRRKKKMDYFNLDKYMGLWYEIFKIPYKWENGCVTATAEYNITNGNMISLKNTCYTKETSYSRSGIGEVNINTDPNVMKKLTIDFTDGLPSDGASEYWIYWTDYNYSIVGNSKKDKVWLLARSPHIHNEDLQKFTDYIHKIGYDTTKVMIVDGVYIL